MRKLSLLLLLAAIVGVVNAQSSANYLPLVTNSDGSLGLDMNANTLDMSTGTTSLLPASTDDTRSSLTNIGFDFWFMGSRVTNFSCTDNGLVELGGNAVGTSTYLISANTTLKLLAPFANDMRVGTDGVIQYKLFGSAPNRVLVIEYKNIMIRYLSTAAAGTGTWQVRLYETTGVIEYMYGAMGTNSATQSAVNVGFGTNTTANTFVSIDATHTANTSGAFATFTPTASSVVTHLNSATEGSRRYYRFTPPAPAAPTGISFTSVTITGMTLNWTDVATNELGYAIYRSTDGVNYSFVSQTAANATSSVQTGLSASTLYYWKIYAVSEGGVSTSLDGNQSTSACSIAGGTYTVGATGTYTSIANAITALVANGITGAVVLELQTDYAPEGAVSFPFVPCASATNTITIRPAAGVAAPIVLTSAAASPTFNINGGQYYIIDGRNGGTGTNKFITIANSSTTGQALQFINEGANNIIRYCTVQGVTTSATSGVIVFSTTTGANGNDNNTIDNCDIRDGATTPANTIYASGTTTTAAQNNSGNTISNNNIFNFFIAGATDAAGVRVDGGNTDWTITANNIYQTGTRTSTAGATGRGIYINNTSGNNFVVTNNFIGGGAPGAAGTAWTTAGAFANRFEGIRLAVGSTTASSVQGNVIRNFAWSSSSGAATLPGVWAGIYVSSGIANVGNTSGNTIGSTGATGSISVVISTTGGVTVGIGSATTGTGTMSISNNSIGGFTLTGSGATVSQSFNGIWVSSSITGAMTISGNTIGSTSTANSIQYATAGTGTTAAVLQGILQAATPTGGATISNNTIANFNNAYVPGTANASTVARGILASSGSNIISGNTVRNLSVAAATTGSGSTASVIGISMTSTSTTTGVTAIDQNTVFALSNTNATAASAVTGIHIGNATSGRNNVTRNLIYNLAASTTSATADIRGISFTSGLDTVKNNMIRLGTDVTNGIPITGIWETGSSSNSAIYFNSIYIGGSGVGTQTGNTYAFRTDQTVNVRTFQNNIFINGRSNATTGGKHYAVRVAGTTPNPTGLALNYNDYQATGTGAVFGFFNSLDVASLAAWRTATGQDANSISGNPQYIDPAGATPDLHIHPTNPTEIEGVGLAVTAITDDYDGQARASFTPTDLGADAGNFVPADLTPPVISYTLIPGTACLTDRSLSATITDVTGINTTAGTKPRLYYKKSTDANTYAGNTNADNGWKYVEASNAASPFTFTTDFTLLQAAVAPGDVIQYFVTAQDIAAIPNVAINSGSFAVAPASVALTAAAFPIGGTINSYTIASALPTSVTVGAAGTYTTLTGAAGLFADINAKYLTGNTTVTILDAAITETGANALNQINYGCSGGPYTLTIKPNTGVTTVLSGSVASPLIDLNGADNVIFDGSNNGSSSKDMTIRNTNTGGQTIRFINDATTNTIQNTIVEGANTSTTSGTIVFSTAATGSTGNSTNTINNCDIRDRSDAAGVPANAVYSSGTTAFPNASNTISNSNIFNHTNTGILVTATGTGNTWVVNANNIYQTAARTAALTGISIQAGNGHAITGNFIGGTAAAAGGTNLVTSSTFRGIDLTVGTVTATSVQGNTVKNIRSTVTGFTSSYGIFLQAGTANIGNITGNTIGSAITAERFEINGDSYGIRVISTSNVNVSNNTINNFGTNSTPSAGEFYFGMSVEGTGGAHTVVNNTIMNVTNASTPDASFSTQTVAMTISATGVQTVRGNIIHDVGSTSTTAPTSNNNRVWGLIMSATGVGSVAEKNYIYNLYGSSTATGARADVITLLQSQTVANATFSNNMVASGTINNGSDRFIFGILDLSATPAVSNYYFNSVNIAGTATGANSTYAFNRNSTATVDIKSNIFSNARTGGTGFHVAIANTNAAATGWAATASNYNDLYSATPGTVAQWLGSALANNRTLAGWKAAQGAGTPGSGGDANSFSELPAFTSATNLHIPNATATQIESGGTPAGGITTDIDNETRPGPTNTNGGGTQVDVGADEFDGTPASAMVYVSSTTTQANVSNVSIGTTNQQVIGIEIVTTGTLTPLDVSMFTLNTNGTTAPLTDITNAKLWYTGTSSTFATTTQYGSTVAAPNGSFNISGSQTLATGTNYFWLTYDVPCGAVLSNVIDAECNIVVVGEAQAPTVQAPAGARTIVASSGLSGTVTIGAAGTYPTITGAGGLFAAINTLGLSGNLTANIVDASVTETGAVALNAINGVCGGPFTLTIKPNTTATLTGSVGTGALIKLNGADGVTIDGSNSGGTDRSLTIQNTTATTSGNAVIWLASPAIGNGANNNTIKNCIIEGNSATTTFTGIHIGGNTTIGITTAGTEPNNNNTINNNLLRKSQYGATLFGFAAATPDQNNVISNNNFGTSVTGEGFSLLAINADRQQGLTVSGNEVQNVVNATNTSSTPFGGIRLLDFKNGLCFNNKVHDLAYTGTSTPKIYGIAMTNATYTTVGNPSNAQIYNNIVYKINSTGVSSVWNMTGILASAGYGDKIYYNSVHLTGQLANSSSGLAAAFANGDGNITSVGTNIDVQNNSFSLTGSSAVAGGNFWAYYTAATTLTGSTLNYNDLYCAGTNATNNVGRFNAVNSTTLAAWQTATGQEANSVAVDPLYNSTSNLVPQLGSPLVSAGTPIGGITTDITGFTRSVTTPTIGAYEQAGDAAGPAITYTVLTFTCLTGDRALNGVVITDASGVPTTGSLQPRVYFRKNAGTWFSTQGTLASGTATNGTWDFNIVAATMGGLTAGDVVQYYVIAQDVAAIPNISSNPSAGLVATDVNTVTTAPTTPNSFTVSTTLAGTYTVGAGGNYTTLTAAVTAYNTSCLAGPVVFNLTDASYSAGETFPISINVNPDANATNTLTIKPAAGIAATVTGTSGATASALIRLNGAKYVTIDGLNTGGASLALENTSVTGGTAVVWLSSNGAGLGASNNTIRNISMKGGVSQNTSTTVTYGIVVAGSTLSSTITSITAGNDNDNNTIQANTITKVRYAIHTRGGSTANPNLGTVISNNIIGPSAFGADAIGVAGVVVREEDGVQITGNEIRFIGGNFAGTSGGADRIGIELGTDALWSASTAPASAYVKNAVVTKNWIHDLVDERTFSAIGVVIAAADGANATNNLVANNMISGLKANGTAGDQTAGIAFAASNTDRVVYNSIYLTGDTDPDGAATTPTQNNFGITVGFSAAVINPQIVDNIVYMDLSSSSATTLANACINVPATYVFGTGQSDYNDFYILPANTQSNIGCVGGIGGTFHATLGAWQGAVTQDANSISVAPVFVSATDLHLVPASNCALHRRGTPIAGITVDYDNDTRNATRPDMGADEYLVPTGGTMTWTGAVSTDWFDVRNWASCEIPGPTSNVVINGSLPNYPNVTANVTIFSLTLNTGASLTAGTGVVITLLGP